MKKERERSKALLIFQKKIGYLFNNEELLEEALTHSSYANESGFPVHNERLEFLGDGVLELVTSERLYKEYTELSEGQLTRLRSQLVCEKSLNRWSVAAGLPELIKLGRSLLKNGATMAMTADAAEAVFGAVFIDGGYKSASEVISGFLDCLKENTSPCFVDSKTRLQELLQGQGRGVPYYETVERTGPGHSLRFRVQVTIDGTILAEAWGNNIKEAEFKAAAIALSNVQ
jgi:ribonuclease-3